MAIPRYRSTDALPLFSAGFRPFFLAAGVWAGVAMLVWVLMLRGVVELPTAFDTLGPYGVTVNGDSIELTLMADLRTLAKPSPLIDDPDM